MQQQSLVSMANQIADFFRYQGDEAFALKGIAGHLSHYWTPRMRLDLIALSDRNGDEGLAPLVKTALTTYRGDLVDGHARVPGEESLEEPKGGGDAG